MTTSSSTGFKLTAAGNSGNITDGTSAVVTDIGTTLAKGHIVTLTQDKNGVVVGIKDEGAGTALGTSDIDGTSATAATVFKTGAR